jgi:peptidoglycan/xylan/chitin deacetylase (PgdA/CDA1 family)
MAGAIVFGETMSAKHAGPAIGRRTLLGCGLCAALVSLVSPAKACAARPRFAWPEGRGGAVSLTYDDSVDSQLDQAIPQLEERRLKGTFFLTRENMLAREEDWRATAKRGHELGNHTLTHPCDLRHFSPNGFIRRQVDPMERYLDSLAPGRRSRLYAYPCDATNLGEGSANEEAHRYALALQKCGIEAARTSEGPPNNPFRIAARRYRLSALAVGYDGGLEGARGYLQMAARTGSWAILVFHDVIEAGKGEGAVTATAHRTILDLVGASGLWCATMGDVLQHILESGARVG